MTKEVWRKLALIGLFLAFCWHVDILRTAMTALDSVSSEPLPWMREYAMLVANVFAAIALVLPRRWSLLVACGVLIPVMGIPLYANILQQPGEELLWAWVIDTVPLSWALPDADTSSRMLTLVTTAYVVGCGFGILTRVMLWEDLSFKDKSPFPFVTGKAC
jgi:hypothetical protein